MAETLKAVIQLVADASGVKSGVNDAVRSLDGIKNGYDKLMSNPAVQLLGKAASAVFDSVMNDLKRVEDAAHMYSAAGARGQAELERAKMEADMAIGRAMGPYQEAIDQAQARRERERGAQIAANPESMANAQILKTEFGNTIQDWGGWLESLAGKTVDFAANPSLSGGADLYKTYAYENPTMKAILDMLNVKLGGS